MKYSEMTKKILDNYSEGKKPPFSLTNDRQIRGWLASAFGLNRVTPWTWKKHDDIPDAVAALCFLRFSGSRNRKISLSKQ